MVSLEDMLQSEMLNLIKIIAQKRIQVFAELVESLIDLAYPLLANHLLQQEPEEDIPDFLLFQSFVQEGNGVP